MAKIAPPELVMVPQKYRQVPLYLKQQTGVPYSQILKQALDVYLPTVMPAPSGLGFIKKEQHAKYSCFTNLSS